MPIQFDKFEQSKVDRLKSHLVTMAAKGQAKPYEIFVDSLKAIPKTDEPSEFEGYEDYLTPDSSQIKIVIYNSAVSPRNDQFVFLLKAKDREEATQIGLSGFTSDSFSVGKINEWRQDKAKKSAEQMEIQNLKRQIAELEELIEEKDEQLEQFSDAIVDAKRNGNKIGGIDIGEAFSVALEGLVRRNTELLAKVPMMEGLAGIIEEDNKRVKDKKQETTSDAEVNFKKKESQASNLSQDEKVFIDFFKELRSHFTENEMGLVFEILENLSKDKEQLQTVVELLQNS
jgi:hypothetical protein